MPKKELSDLKRRHTEMIKKSEEKIEMLSDSEDTLSEKEGYDVL
jgi:hypothetical protein